MYTFLLAFFLFLPAAHADTTAETPAFRVQTSGQGARHMLLLPGLSCSGDVWRETAAHFGKTYTVHVFTLAGFAGEPPIEAPFLEHVAEALVRYIRTEGLDRPVIMGHSLGAFLSYRLASAHPDLVGPVIAVDGLPFLGALSGGPDVTAASLEPMARQMRDRMAGVDAEGFAAQTRASLAAMITAPADVKRVAADAVRSNPATVGDAFYELLTTDLRADLGSVRAPLLLIGAFGAVPEGMREGYEAAYRAQIAAAPHARFVIAQRARHFVMLDDPGFLFETVASFLAAAQETPGSGAVQ